ncbi:MAG: DUF2505 domain-containing protein [Myxococcota bacterium]
MKLDVRHFYPCTPERWWEMYWDEGFDALLNQDSTVDREVLDEREENGLLVRRLRFTPKQELPAAAAKIVGAKKLVYEQINTFDRTKGLLTWKVLPSFMDASKFKAEGTLTAVPTGNGCESHVQGEITVSVMFIGGQIEKAIVTQTTEAYDRMAIRGKEWLSANPTGGQS